MNKRVDVIDISGRVWYAAPAVEPSAAGLLPSGQRSWEFGLVDRVGSWVYGDWMTEGEAIESMLEAAAEMDRQAGL